MKNYFGIYVIFGRWNQRKRGSTMTTTHQGAPGAAGAPRWVMPTWCTPSDVICIKNSEIFRKNRVKFLGHPENFYFWVIFHCTEKIRKQTKHGILFYLTKKNREQKVGTKGSAY